MMLQTMQRHPVLFHFIAWIVYIPLDYIYNIPQVGSVKWEYIIALCTLYALIFYSVYFSLVWLSDKKFGFMWCVFAVITLYFVLAGVGYILIYDLLPLFGIKFYVDGEAFNWTLYFRNILPHYTKFATNACLFFFISRAFRAVQLARENETERFNAERERFEYEQAFLRAQINPHFLHNTLNMLHRKAKKLSAELADGIYRLSAIMRYTLDSAQSQTRLTPLHREVEHLSNLLEIHAARFGDDKRPVFELNGEIYGHRIPPLSLITLVENAFKFGDLSDSANPLFIKLCARKDKIYFYCRNKKKRNVMHESSNHIGISNLTRRLDVEYKGMFTIWPIDEKEFYSVELIIYIEDDGQMRSN